ncbi:hypothetical protein KP509_37G064300 [Ceratopteris richardii]|uniref:ribonuclease P n=1 Tax=Ceratopteris richardii TaxID=49495 RepID=A0A8T2QA32_CERRI|nr:hypothetical protein KP509_37G064300 [Ceratopteris richardii]
MFELGNREWSLMESPRYSPAIRQVPTRFLSANTTHRIILVRLGHPTLRWKSILDAQLLVTTSSNAPLSVSTTDDFQAFSRIISPSTSGNSSTFVRNYEYRVPQCALPRRRLNSNTTNRKGDSLTANVDARIGYNLSRRADEDIHYSHKISNSTSSSIQSNVIKRSKKSDVESAILAPLTKENSNREIQAREYEPVRAIDKIRSRKDTGSSVVRRKNGDNKEVLNNSLKSNCKKETSCMPMPFKPFKPTPPRKKYKPRVLLQANIEEEEAAKREKSKERIAMAEANGYKLSKRAKKNPEEVQHVIKLNLCSKHGDLYGALEIYDAVKERELFKLKQQHYNILLYICSGAASGSIVTGKNNNNSSERSNTDNQPTIYRSARSETTECEPATIKDVDAVYFSPEDRQLAAKRGTEIYNDMLRSNVSPNEATFTAVARLAVAMGDGDLAFETVKKMESLGVVPKLRSYGPPLLCFCEHNQVEKAFEVDDHMTAAGVLPDEALLEALLRVSISAGLWPKVYTLLHRLRKTVREVTQNTAMTIEKWFNSEAAGRATFEEDSESPSIEDIEKAINLGGGGWHGLGWLGQGKWITKRTNISKVGVCQSCGETLCSIDLDPEETEKFARSVAELAMQREQNANDFVKFQVWLEKNGPFEAILDGANIGMYNCALRGFNYSQVYVHEQLHIISGKIVSKNSLASGMPRLHMFFS